MSVTRRVFSSRDHWFTILDTSGNGLKNVSIFIPASLKENLTPPGLMYCVPNVPKNGHCEENCENEVKTTKKEIVLKKPAYWDVSKVNWRLSQNKCAKKATEQGN